MAYLGNDGMLFPQAANQSPLGGVQALSGGTPLNPMNTPVVSNQQVGSNAVQGGQPVVDQQKKSLGTRFKERVQGWFGGGPGKPRTGQGKFWLGEEEERGLMDILTPEQIEMVKLIGPEGVKMLLDKIDNSPIQNTLSQVTQGNIDRNQPFNFAPFREQAINRFNEETLPGIFERFTSLGKGAQSTGAFQGMLARGGADLNRGLASLEQEYGLKNRELEGREGLKIQELLQDLLKNQQGYDIAGRTLGLNTVRTGLTQTAAPYYKASTPGAAPDTVGAAAKAAAEAALLAAFI